MSTESLKELNRGIDIAENALAGQPHGSQYAALLMKLSEVRMLAESLMGDTIAVPSSGMMGQMS